MTITMPLFALRADRTSGNEYAMFNLMKGLQATGGDLRVAYSRYVSPAILQWVEVNHIPSRRFPGMGPGMTSRFPEEALYGLLERADQVIFPNYFLPFAPRIRRRSVFHYDVQHRVFPQYFSPAKRRWMDFAIKRTLAKADRILFISRFEFEQAQRFYGEEFSDRGAVVHVAIDWDRFNRGSIRDGLLPEGRRPYILSVSQQHPHKRLDLLIRAFGMLARRQKDIALVLVGRPAAGRVGDALKELDEDAARRVHTTGFVNDAELGHLYREATLFALPSVYEGFGMPAVEAMSFGKPALLADASAVPEATMGFARYLPEAAGAADWSAELEAMLLSPPTIGDVQVNALREGYDPITIAKRVRAVLRP